MMSRMALSSPPGVSSSSHHQAAAAGARRLDAVHHVVRGRRADRALDLEHRGGAGGGWRRGGVAVATSARRLPLSGERQPAQGMRRAARSMARRRHGVAPYSRPTASAIGPPPRGLQADLGPRARARRARQAGVLGAEGARPLRAARAAGRRCRPAGRPAPAAGGRCRSGRRGPCGAAPRAAPASCSASW